MHIIHITGPAGSGKSTALRAIVGHFGHCHCLQVSGDASAAGITQALQQTSSIRSVMIDDFDPARIDLDAITPHEDSPHITFYVAHQDAA